MRGPADKEKIELVIQELGRRAKGPGRVYLVGGSSVVLEGGRAATIDVDLKLDPEPEGIFEAIESRLIRFPRIEAGSFRKRVERCVNSGP